MRALQALGPQAQQMPPQMLYPQLLNSLIDAKVVSAQGYAEGLQNDKEVKERMKELLLEVERLSRALRDPSLAEEGLRMALGNQKTA